MINGGNERGNLRNRKFFNFPDTRKERIASLFKWKDNGRWRLFLFDAKISIAFCMNKEKEIMSANLIFVGQCFMDLVNMN